MKSFEGGGEVEVDDTKVDEVISSISSNDVYDESSAPSMEKQQGL